MLEVAPAAQASRHSLAKLGAVGECEFEAVKASHNLFDGFLCATTPQSFRGALMKRTGIGRSAQGAIDRGDCSKCCPTTCSIEMLCDHKPWVSSEMHFYKTSAAVLKRSGSSSSSGSIRGEAAGVGQGASSDGESSLFRLTKLGGGDGQV